MPTFRELIRAIKEIGFHDAVFAFVLFYLTFLVVYLLRRLEKMEEFNQELIRKLMKWGDDSVPSDS